MSVVEQLQTSGSLIGRIEADRPSLSKACGRVADMLISAPAQFMTSPVQEISAAAGVSEPSVVRFCRHYDAG